MATLIVNDKRFNFTPTKGITDIMRVLHHARRVGFNAYIETAKGTYYLKGTRLAKLVL